jgi:hypothetical protein
MSKKAMKERNEKLRDLQAIALSSKQLQNNTPKHIPILTYKDIYGKSLDKLLKNGAFILLYLWEERFGHWTAVIRHHNGKDVEYFDSYGKKPDFWLSKNTHEKNKKLGQEKPYLLNKIIKDNKHDHIFYNPVTFQDSSDERDIMTCGRWVLTRILNRDLSLEEFEEYIENVMKKHNIKTKDGAVAFLTRHIDEQH